MVRGTWDEMSAVFVQHHCRSAVWPHFNGPVLSCPLRPPPYQPVTSHSSLHGWNNSTVSSATGLPWYVTFTARINPQNSWTVSYILCHMKCDLFCGSTGWFHHFELGAASILICSSPPNEQINLVLAVRNGGGIQRSEFKKRIRKIIDRGAAHLAIVLF